MPRSEKDGARDAPRNEKRAEARRMVATRKKETSRGRVESCQGSRGMVPRNEGVAPSAQGRTPRNKSVPLRKGGGTAKFGYRKSAEITICTQSYNIIGTFSTYLYTSIVLFLGALTHDSRFDSWRA